MSGLDRARARAAAKAKTGQMHVEGSIYEGMEACLTSNGRTVAHVVKHADAIEIATAVNALRDPASGGAK